jgi:DNA-binding transcriptional LysR family regulator
VRITNTLDDSLVARPLARCRSVLCAAPAYLKRHGRPESPQDLARHRRGDRPGDGPAVEQRDGGAAPGRVAGAGMAMLPTYDVVDDLRRGALVRLLPQHEPETMGMHAVYPSRRYQPHALRVLVEWLAQRLGGDVAPWDVALVADGLSGASAPAAAVQRGRVPGRRTARTVPLDPPPQ